MSEIEGWCSPEKAEDMRQLILREAPKVVVEIGVYAGASLLPQARALRDVGSGVIYAIDAWDSKTAADPELSEADREWWSKVDLAHHFHTFVSAVSREQLWRWVRILYAPAKFVTPNFPPSSIDILHIDGCHTESASMQDVGLYAIPRVRPGGFVWLDDCDFPQLQMAYRLLEREMDLIRRWEKYALFQHR